MLRLYKGGKYLRFSASGCYYFNESNKNLRGYESYLRRFLLFKL